MNNQKIQDSIALVTGSNRGIGKAFVETLLDQGAKKVYATARNVSQLKELSDRFGDKVVPLQLDVTREADISKVAELAQDVNLIINNAGYAAYTALIASPDLSTLRKEMDINFYGLLNVIRAFAPILKTNQGGAIVNISSIGGLVGIPMVGTYSATKAAVHSLTQSVRGELAAQQTLVVGVYPGPVDTDMAAGMELDKESPVQVAHKVLEAVERGQEDVYPDPVSESTAQGLNVDAKAVERQWAQMLPTAVG